MWELEKEDLLSELEDREKELASIPVIIDTTFESQHKFIIHPARLKAALCTRRSGKSYGDGLYLFKEAMENAGVNCLYLGLTRDTCWRIMWKDVLKVINNKYGIGSKFNETKLTITLPNGSMIYLLGADSDEDEKNKVLGQKYKLVIIDEAQSYTINLRDLVYKMLRPAMADLRGTIVLTGTPCNITQGLFYDITTGIELGWEVARWSALDNPYMVKQWNEEIADMIATNPLAVETASFKQMYLGEWVIDTDKLVYKYEENRNDFKMLPVMRSGEWHYVLGIDLGYEDDSAFIVGCYHDYNTNLYIVDEYCRKHMDITEVANKIKELSDKYQVEICVIDGSAKQAVKEMENRHGLSLIPSDKTGKSDFIELMNGEFIMKKILLGQNVPKLKEEYSKLVWDDNDKKRVEHPACKNHRTDASLYLWRYCYQWLSKILPIKPLPNTKEWFIEEERRLEEEAEKNARKSIAYTDDGTDGGITWD